jgi:hypothetical protein
VVAAIVDDEKDHEKKASADVLSLPKSIIE